MVFRILPVLLPAVCFLQDAGAYNPLRSGNEAGFWEDRAVVIVTVRRVGPPSGDDAMQLRARVLAVVATNHMVPTDLRLKYPIRFANTSLWGFSPQRGETYALCIRYVRGNWELERHGLKFFDSGGGAERIAGLDDPKVNILLSRIVELRGKSRHAAGDPDNAQQRGDASDNARRDGAT